MKEKIRDRASEKQVSSRYFMMAKKGENASPFTWLSLAPSHRYFHSFFPSRHFRLDCLPR